MQDSDHQSTVWKAHWPGFEDCSAETPAHDMILLARTWRCRGCGSWFNIAESPEVAAYMAAAQALLLSIRYDGGTPQRFISPTF